MPHAVMWLSIKAGEIAGAEGRAPRESMISRAEFQRPWRKDNFVSQILTEASQGRGGAASEGFKPMRFYFFLFFSIKAHLLLQLIQIV